VSQFKPLFSIPYEMTESLCRNDTIKWEESTSEVKKVLSARIKLWDVIEVQLN